MVLSFNIVSILRLVFELIVIKLSPNLILSRNPLILLFIVQLT